MIFSRGKTAPAYLSSWPSSPLYRRTPASLPTTDQQGETGGAGGQWGRGDGARGRGGWGRGLVAVGVAWSWYQSIPHLAAGEDVPHAHTASPHGDQAHTVGAPRARRHGAGPAQLPLQRPRLFRFGYLFVDCHCRHGYCGVLRVMATPKATTLPPAEGLRMTRIREKVQRI